MTLEQIEQMARELRSDIGKLLGTKGQCETAAKASDLIQAIVTLIAEEQKASEYQKALALSGECDCLDRIRKTLSEHHGCDIEFELVPTINTKTMDHGAALPPLYYHCDTGRRSKRQHVKFTYCPFCRRKLD